MKKLSSLIFVPVLALLLVSCGGADRPAAKIEPAAEKTEKTATANECLICDGFDFSGYQGELKKAEAEGLLLALNDEYLALAVYQRVNREFDSPRPFVNIRPAEARHAARLIELFERYKIPVPENPWPASERLPAYQSVAAACRAGIEGEIINRNLYEKLLGSTEREDILSVYRALQRASEENHLPAFRRCAGNRGGDKDGRRRRGPGADGG